MLFPLNTVIKVKGGGDDNDNNDSMLVEAEAVVDNGEAAMEVRLDRERTQ